jgi:hypothetical protein
MSMTSADRGVGYIFLSIYSTTIIYIVNLDHIRTAKSHVSLKKHIQ